MLHAARDQLIEQGSRLHKIILEIHLRLFDRFANVCERRKVHTRRDRMLVQYTADNVVVTDVAEVERRVIGDGFAMPATKVIYDNDVKTLCFEKLDRYAADISGTAGYKNCHFEILSRFVREF